MITWTITIESPNVEAHKFYDMLAATNEPIYDGATESKL